MTPALAAAIMIFIRTAISCISAEEEEKGQSSTGIQREEPLYMRSPLILEATHQRVFKEMKESFYLAHPFVFILNSGKIVLTVSLFLLLSCAESGPAELAGTGFHGVTHER